eukprot:sb/3477117/
MPCRTLLSIYSARKHITSKTIKILGDYTHRDIELSKVKERERERERERKIERERDRERKIEKQHEYITFCTQCKRAIYALHCRAYMEMKCTTAQLECISYLYCTSETSAI